MAYQPNSSTSSTLTTAAPSSGQSARETSGTCDSPRSRTYATPPPPPTLERGDREAKEEIKDSVARTPTQAWFWMPGRYDEMERREEYFSFQRTFLMSV